MRTRTLAAAALLTLMGVLMAMPVSAQRGPRGRGVQARAGCAEGALRLKDGLELNESQVAQLEELRSSCVERQQAHQAQALEMRSRLAAGQITPDDFRTAMEARRETAQVAREQNRNRLEEILTEEQLNELDRSLWRGGRAGRGVRGPDRGFRGRNWRDFPGRGRSSFDRRGWPGRRGPPPGIPDGPPDFQS